MDSQKLGRSNVRLVPEHGGADAAALWTAFATAGTPEEFCRAWLGLQCRIIAGVGAGVVFLGAPAGGPFAPVALWPDGRRDLTHLGEIAEQALASRKGLVIHRESPGGDRCHVAYPIEVEGRVRGVVALDVAGRSEPQLQGVMRQLQWGAAWLEVLARRGAATGDTATAERLQSVLFLAATVVEPERFHEAASAFVTEVATHLGCDRVSLGFRRRGRVALQAISHSAQFGKKTNLTRAIEAAMDEALDEGATVVHPPLAGAPPRSTRAHEDLARQSDGVAVCSLPFARTGTWVGALTLERPAERPFDSRTVEVLEAVVALAGPMLEIRRREDRWLAAKAAEVARLQLERLLGPRHAALKLGAAAAAAVLLLCVLAKGDYRVTAKTVIEPAVRRAAVAPFNGFIATAGVRAGDLVHAGDVLGTLDDRELHLEYAKWVSQQEQLLKQYRQALAERKAADVEILTAQLDQARAQGKLIADQLSRMQVRAPFDGVIVTGDLSQALGAPVERGQVLFEVAPLEDYRVILQVDERDVAAIALGQRGQLALSADPSAPLGLDVEKLTPVSTPIEGRNYFRVEARLDETPARLRPGMEGVSKVIVGRRRMIWIWTHEVIDWMRLALWRWLP